MKPLSADVTGGRLVIVVEAEDETSYYDLAAAEEAVGAALGCEVDVVTIAMLPRKRGEDMVTGRKPDETDDDYMARIGDDARRWELVLADVDRAVRYLSNSAALGRHPGFNELTDDGWQKRSAFLRGIDVARAFIIAALDRRTVRDLPPELKSALDNVIRCRVNDYDTLEALPQAEVDAVCDAADVIVEKLKLALEALKKGDH